MGTEAKILLTESANSVAIGTSDITFRYFLQYGRPIKIDQAWDARDLKVRITMVEIKRTRILPVAAVHASCFKLDGV
jgi:hypothetical protein